LTIKKLTIKNNLLKMTILTNTNIIKLIFETFISPQHLLNNITNKTICSVILKTLDYLQIYKALGKSKDILADKVTLPTLLLDNNIITKSGGELKIYNTDNYQCTKSLKYYSHILSMVELPYNHIAISSSNEITILDINAKYMCIKKLPIKISQKYGFLFVLPNSDLGCIVNYTKVIIFYQDTDYTTSKEFTTEGQRSSCVTSLSNRMIAIGSHCLINVYNVLSDELKCLKRLRGCFTGVTALIYISRNNLLISGADRKIYFWDVNSDFSCVNVVEVEDEIYSLCLLSGGYLAYGGLNGITIYNLKSYVLVIHIFNENAVIDLKQLKDNRLYSGSSDNVGVFWNYNIK
jgi:WD40 repeat protein